MCLHFHQHCWKYFSRMWSPFEPLLSKRFKVRELTALWGRIGVPMQEAPSLETLSSIDQRGTRQHWRGVATEDGVGFVMIEFIIHRMSLQKERLQEERKHLTCNFLYREPITST
jgi:hypothetical protein